MVYLILLHINSISMRKQSQSGFTQPQQRPISTTPVLCSSETHSQIISIFPRIAHLYSMLCKLQKPMLHKPKQSLPIHSTSMTIQSLMSLIDKCEEVIKDLLRQMPIFESVQEFEDTKMIYEVMDKNYKISQLRKQLVESEKSSRNFHKKLMLSIKKLKIQIEDKNKQISQLNNAIVEKDKALIDMTSLYENKVKLIKKMKSEKTELTDKMDSLEEQLITQKQCSFILEQKLSRVYQKQFEGQSSIMVQDQPTKQKEGAKQIQRQKIEEDQSETCSQSTKIKQNLMEIGTQTAETDQDETISLMSDGTQMTDSKQGKYLQSIDRLTSELSDAYEKINDLMNLDMGKSKQKKGQKPRTSTSYFQKIFK